MHTRRRAAGAAAEAGWVVLTEAAPAPSQAKNKAAQMLLDNEALSKDRDELHQKFEAKCRCEMRAERGCAARVV